MTLTFDKFEGWMSRYIKLLDRLMRARRVVGTPVDKKEILSAFVFKIVADWEVFVEDLMTDCLNRDCTQYGEFMEMRLSKNLPRNVCHAMLTGLGYTDFRSVGHIKDVAAKILVDAHNPFKAIPPTIADRIDEFTKMRNYLAHYSTPARRSLYSSYRRHHKLKNFREPEEFLFATNRRTKQLRFGDYIDAYLGASQGMRKALGV